jgi:hypothetical protein
VYWEPKSMTATWLESCMGKVKAEKLKD